MGYSSLESCLIDLEKTGQLVRIKEQVDPELEMASIHLRTYAAGGPALLFENVKGSRYRAASNIFGTLERSKFIFRDTLKMVQQIIEIKNDPLQVMRSPLANLSALRLAPTALPLRNPHRRPVMEEKIRISDLPQIRHWPMDGGSFITLPIVYTEDLDTPGFMKANLGMYRIQLSGNEYIRDEEVGLHYQIHRGIGIHQAKARKKGVPLKVSIFVGGPPAHTIAAVMPLPEGLSEVNFAGILGGRRFRYAFEDGYAVSTEADFVITGEVENMDTKPEGPFGDHLGYYSLVHPFPVMKVKQVYARKDAIWPFTVVGRPPQEDTSFGALIHEITGDAIRVELPGVKEVHAVDAAGVHPLLLAVGTERYTPFTEVREPMELLTQANHILGSNQLSLAKYLLIGADPEGRLHTHDIEAFFRFILERADFERDLHFQTNTTIDTLDYSGTALNRGSKVIIAATGNPIRKLITELPRWMQETSLFQHAALALPGVVMVQTNPFTSYADAALEMQNLNRLWKERADLDAQPALLVLCDDASFAAQTLNNFLWVTFTRSNPSHDVYGIGEIIENKHWGCKGPLIIDARAKPHHAPPLLLDPEVEKKVDRFFTKGGVLGKWG